jgi:hypothetical protein
MRGARGRRSRGLLTHQVCDAFRGSFRGFVFPRPCSSDWRADSGTLSLSRLPRIEALTKDDHAQSSAPASVQTTRQAVSLAAAPLWPDPTSTTHERLGW